MRTRDALHLLHSTLGPLRALVLRCNKHHTLGSTICWIPILDSGLWILDSGFWTFASMCAALRDYYIYSVNKP